MSLFEADTAVWKCGCLYQGMGIINMNNLYSSVCVRRHKHIDSFRDHATERYENCCDEEYPLADGDGRAVIFFLSINVEKKKRFFAQSGSTKWVLSEQLRCAGSGTNSSTSRCVVPLYKTGHYYCKGNVCDQFFTQFNYTEWVRNREPERSQLTS